MGNDGRSMGELVAADAAIAELPDELLLDIFARLGPEILDLLRCAGTCVRWFRLIIADPAFLRRAGLLPEKAAHAPVLIGAFYTYANLICPCKPEKVFEPDEPPQFARLYHTPRPSRGVAAAHLGFASLLPNTDGVFDYAEPMTSRRGLLLLRVMPRPIDTRKLHLAVCHPVIGEQATRFLPPPPLDLNPKFFGHEVIGYALVTSADDHPNGGDLDHYQRRSRNPTAFRVILTVVHSDDQLLHVHSYSSATGSWSLPIRCPQASGLALAGQRDGVVVRGTAHWVYMDQGNLLHTLDVSADTSQVSVTKTPIRVQEDPRGYVDSGTAVACVAGGKLLIVVNAASLDGTPQFWTMGEQDNNVQQRQFDEGICGLRPEVVGTKIIAFAECQGAMIVHCAGPTGLFTLDLQSTEIKPLNGEDRQWGLRRSCSTYSRQPMPDGSSCLSVTCDYRVLYEMDWPSYLRHLSTMCK